MLTKPKPGSQEELEETLRQKDYLTSKQMFEALRFLKEQGGT